MQAKKAEPTAHIKGIYPGVKTHQRDGRKVLPELCSDSSNVAVRSGDLQNKLACLKTQYGVQAS